MKSIVVNLYSKLETAGSWMNAHGVLIQTSRGGLIQLCAPLEGKWDQPGVQPIYYAQFSDLSAFLACFGIDTAIMAFLTPGDLESCFMQGLAGVYCRCSQGSLLFRQEPQGQFVLVVEEGAYLPVKAQLKSAADYKNFTRTFFSSPA